MHGTQNVRSGQMATYIETRRKRECVENRDGLTTHRDEHLWNTSSTQFPPHTLRVSTHSEDTVRHIRSLTIGGFFFFLPKVPSPNHFFVFFAPSAPRFGMLTLRTLFICLSTCGSTSTTKHCWPRILEIPPFEPPPSPPQSFAPDGSNTNV